MTDKDILTKAIFKAINNGYKKDNNKLYLIARGNIKSILSIEFYRSLIFDHDFAKAFWGKQKIWGNNSNLNYEETNKAVNNQLNYDWEYHLQQIVVEKEPLKYLEKFL